MFCWTLYLRSLKVPALFKNVARQVLVNSQRSGLLAVSGCKWVSWKCIKFLHSWTIFVLTECAFNFFYMFNAVLALNLLKIPFWLTRLRSVETAIVCCCYLPSEYSEVFKAFFTLRSGWMQTATLEPLRYFDSSPPAKHPSIKHQQLDHWTVLLRTWSLAAFTSYFLSYSENFFLLPQTIKPASVKVNADGGCACIFANPGLRCLAGTSRKQLLRFVSWFVRWPVLPAASYCANNLNLRHGLLLAERYPSCGERQD